ncbi:hypothetical protein R3P38DRAFT_3377061 [Favolaschia claudopus]|uniref:Uncharacterized protein n=1 Tax=Favolaschia claudopus TaxID=2862362 RepID=A0AAV9ZDF4_9AGAR
MGVIFSCITGSCPCCIILSPTYLTTPPGIFQCIGDCIMAIVGAIAGCLECIVAVPEERQLYDQGLRDETRRRYNGFPASSRVQVPTSKKSRSPVVYVGQSDSRDIGLVEEDDILSQSAQQYLPWSSEAFGIDPTSVSGISDQPSLPASLVSEPSNVRI